MTAGAMARLGELGGLEADFAAAGQRGRKDTCHCGNVSDSRGISSAPTSAMSHTRCRAAADRRRSAAATSPATVSNTKVFSPASANAAKTADGREEAFISLPPPGVFP
jgi:hypothetical protein